MDAVAATDVPLHAGLGGRLAGTFVARPSARRLAGIAAWWVLVVGGLAIALAAAKPWQPQAAIVVVTTLMLGGFAGVGLAVRRAQVTVDAGGVRWGWGWLAFRLERDRIRTVDVYRDAIAFRRGRGSTWFLTAWDWDRFDGLVLAVQRAGLPTRVNDRRAPIGARLQSYGRVLDGLLVISMLGVTVLCGLALTF
jgi:hypothetical protein